MHQKKRIILLRGPHFTVECAIRKNGRCESKNFLDSLNRPERAKIIKIIKRLADYGVVHNREQYKKVEGNIWEFKEYQTRILMYHCARGCIALTNGFFKKGKRIPSEQIKRAITIQGEYDQIRQSLLEKR